MDLPVQITFHNMSPSESIEAAIREKAAKLTEFFDRIVHCRVVIDVPHKHHERGNLYQVKIDLKVPGREIAVTREAGAHAACKDIYVAIRDAFSAAVRQMEDHIRKGLRHDVKQHEPVPYGRVSRLFPDEGYGFLRTPDGREVYFHKNAVLNGDFQRLQPGTEVSFVEEPGEKGPQASTVKPVGRHGHHG
jgi:ribosomal subunit interface protein